MIYMFLANGFEEIEALMPLDLMRRAGLEVTTVGIGGKDITGSHGITVKADITDSDLADNAPECVILPGGMPGTKNLDASPVVHKALDDALENNSLICAICAAPMILGKRGILRGKKATCFPGFEEYLEGATVGGRAVRDGQVITGIGMGAALEFGIEIVAALKGREEAEKLAAAVLAK
ncbi:MAG: DJ-1/PfpI family protein [Clostridia bacterium]|nr:DJ-1/PfpI family protein [Clostridia bacterium]